MPWDLDHPLSLMSISSKYKISDIDDAGAVQYYGFVDRNGEWFIMELDTSASPKTFRYANGTNDYSTNWGVRSLLSYNYYDNVF